MYLRMDIRDLVSACTVERNEMIKIVNIQSVGTTYRQRGHLDKLKRIENHENFSVHVSSLYSYY